MNALLIVACMMVGGYLWSVCLGPQSNSTEMSPESVDSNSNPNCQGWENPSENPPGFLPCPLRDVKNHPEIHRQIILMKSTDYFKALSEAPGSSEGYPVVTNSYGLPNIASLYFGGSIASIRNSVPFVPQGSRCGPVGCLNPVESIIQPDIIKPGNNWHFQGEEATLVIELPAPAAITGFTLIHPTSRELPTGYFKSAPKHFEVHGMKDLEDEHPHSLGKFEYRSNGPAAQTFRADNIECDLQFKFIQVGFKTNHGNPVYTAVYKFQVHGDLGEPWFDGQALISVKVK